jgi:hypothetical protein
VAALLRGPRRIDKGVIRGLDPRIHPSSRKVFRRGWIAGSSPAMTIERMYQD